jgi:putative peptidoglycan lipid II flippase
MVDHPLAQESPTRDTRSGNVTDVNSAAADPEAGVVAEPGDEGERHLVRSSTVVGLGTALSRVTGLVRVLALAGIGFTGLTDAYNLANNTPNIIYELVLGGILTATIVPLYVEYLKRDDQRASDAINTVSIVVLLAISVLGVLIAPWLIRLYASLKPSGAGNQQQQQLATDLLRWFMPQVFFYGVTELASAMLNARRRFAAAAFAPILNNVIVIAVLLALPRAAHEAPTVHSVLDDPGLVLLLGLGTTAGVVAMALVLLPALRSCQARFRWTWEWRHPAVRQLARLSSWTLGYVIANQVALAITMALAYRHAGDLSLYAFAFAVFQLPHGLFAVSIMTALAPELAAAAQRGDIASLREQLGNGFRLMALVVLPSSVILAVVARPMTNGVLPLLASKSVPTHPATTADVLVAFMVGLLAYSTYLFMLRGFYALQDTRTPFWLNCLENGLNIALAFALYAWIGVRGLALSWSLAYIGAGVVTLYAMRRRLGRLEGRRMVDSALRVAGASAVMGIVAYAAESAIGYDSTGSALLAMIVAVVAGGVVFLGAAWLFRVKELTMLRDALRPSARQLDPAAPGL